MSNTILKPTIYIGLGGTGVMSVAHTKKMYEDEFGVGNIPPQIAFIAIDSDPTILDRTIADISENFIDLVTGADPKEYYKVRNGVYGEIQWMFPENAPDSSKMYRSLRTDGRLCTEISYHRIERVVRMCYDKVQYNADGNCIVDVYIATSLAGATGAGSFLTVAHMLKDMYQNRVDLFGYGVNYEIFSNSNPITTHLLYSNAYASIMDIDYTMHASHDNPKELYFVGGKTTIKAPYFYQFYVVDNRSFNYEVRNIDDMFQNVGLAMYASSKINFPPIHWWWGYNDVGNKKAWVHGFGCCQIVFRGDLYAEIYKCKAVKTLISNIILRGEIGGEEALEWKKLNVDSIFPSEEISRIQLPFLNIADTIEVTLEKLHRYLDDVSFFPDEEAIVRRENHLAAELDKKLEWYLEENNGVGNCIEFLEVLLHICREAIYEKKWMITEMLSRLTTYKHILDEGIEEYVRRRNNSFTYNFRSVLYKQTLLEECLQEPSRKFLEYKIELKRNEAAERILRKLIDFIEVHLQKVRNLKDMLVHIEYGDCSAILDNLYKQLNLKSSFECNIINSQSIVSNEFVFDYLRSGAKFIKTLDRPLCEYNREQLLEAMMHYVDSLPGVEQYRNTDILDIIEGMSDDELRDLESMVLEKSGVLLNMSGKGLVVDRVPVVDRTVSNMNFLYYDSHNIGYEVLSKRFQYSQVLHLNNQFIRVNNPSMRQKIVVYRTKQSIIPYCLGAFSNSTEYINGRTCNPHYDRAVYEWMQENDFKLKPEMSNE